MQSSTSVKNILENLKTFNVFFLASFMMNYLYSKDNLMKQCKDLHLTLKTIQEVTRTLTRLIFTTR